MLFDYTKKRLGKHILQVWVHLILLRLGTRQLTYRCWYTPHLSLNSPSFTMKLPKPIKVL